MKKNQRPVTLAEHLVQTVGWRKALQAATFIVSWGIYVDDTAGVEHTVEGYAAYWNQSRAQSFREQQSFRKAFPDDVLPDRIWALAKGQVQERADRRVAALQSMAVALT